MFREALEDGARFVAGNPEKAREYIAKYTKQSLEILQTVELPHLSPKLTPASIDDWIDLMNEQKMLKTKLDGASLELK